MLKTSNLRSFFLVRTAIVLLVVVAASTAALAQTVTFGQFIQRTGAQDFIFTNQATGATFQTVLAGSPVYFTFSNIANLPPELQGPQTAHVFVEAGTATPAFQAAGSPPRDIQPFNQPFTIRILRDAPASTGTGSRRNLLTVVITPDAGSQASLAGDDQSDAAAFTASSAIQNVQYSSDFLGFSPTGGRNLGLSFSSVNPLYSIGPGGFLNSFSAAGTGTFASNPAPVFNPPTAAGVSVGGRIVGGSAASLRARVVLTEATGAERTTSVNHFGYFRFDDVAAGQTVTLTVVSKSAVFAPVILNLEDSVTDVEIRPLE